jgi:putative copper export protein
MLDAFHAVALTAVVLLVMSGVGHTLAFVSEVRDVTATRWGRLLTVKLAFVAATLALGYRHWRGAEARIRAGEREAVSASLAREVIVAVAVLSVTGLLTVTSPPE